MWRLVFKAGKALLTDSSVAKGTTILSEHTSKKAGEAALKKVQSVPVKKIPEGDPKTVFKGDPVWEGRQRLSKEKFDAQQKARKAFVTKRPGYQEAVDKNKAAQATNVKRREAGKSDYKPFKKMEKSETVYRGKKPKEMAVGGKVKKKAKKGYTKKYAKGGGVRKVRR